MLNREYKVNNQGDWDLTKARSPQRPFKDPKPTQNLT